MMKLNKQSKKLVVGLIVVSVIAIFAILVAIPGIQDIIGKTVNPIPQAVNNIEDASVIIDSEADKILDKTEELHVVAQDITQGADVIINESNNIISNTEDADVIMVDMNLNLDQIRAQMDSLEQAQGTNWQTVSDNVNGIVDDLEGQLSELQVINDEIQGSAVIINNEAEDIKENAEQINVIADEIADSANEIKDKIDEIEEAINVIKTETVVDECTAGFVMAKTTAGAEWCYDTEECGSGYWCCGGTACLNLINKPLPRECKTVGTYNICEGPEGVCVTQGNEKYPEVSDSNKWILRKGGKDSLHIFTGTTKAYTYTDETIYAPEEAALKAATRGFTEIQLIQEGHPKNADCTSNVYVFRGTRTRIEAGTTEDCPADHPDWMPDACWSASVKLVKVQHIREEAI